MRIRYLRRKNRTPYGVVIEKDGQYAWSFCCQYDIFNKKFGKKLAMSRLTKGGTNKIMPRDIAKLITYMKEYGK